MDRPALLQFGRAPKGNCDNNSYKRSKKKKNLDTYIGDKEEIDIRYLKRRYLLKQTLERIAGFCDLLKSRISLFSMVMTWGGGRIQFAYIPFTMFKFSTYSRLRFVFFVSTRRHT